MMIYLFAILTAIVLFLLGGITMELGLCWGGVLLAAAVILEQDMKNKKKIVTFIHRGWAKYFSGALVTTGSCMIAAGMAHHLFGIKRTFEAIFFFVAISILILMACMQDIYKAVFSTEMVEAECTKVYRLAGGGIGRRLCWIATYKYEWQGKRYEQESDITYVGLTGSEFKEGIRYNIYINPKYPDIVRHNRRPSVLNLFFAPLGIIGLGWGVFLLVRMFV